MNEKEFCLWVENQKNLSGIDFDFHITPHGANQSNITPPTIYINKNMLNKPDEIKGVFLHELGHVAHPLDEKTKRGLAIAKVLEFGQILACLLYTSPSPRDAHESRMPSSA